MRPGLAPLECCRNGIKEVLVEELCSPDDQEHQARCKGERARYASDLAEAWLDGRVGDAERRDAEDDGKPGNEAGRGQLQHRLVEAPLAFLSSTAEDLGGVGSEGHRKRILL